MPSPAVTFTFTNSTTSDGPNVSTNFSDILAAMTDGTKDFVIRNLTCNGSVVLGDALGDTITWTGTGNRVLLNNAATDGGAVYFDGGTTAFLKCNAAGTTISTGGVTDLDHASVKAAYQTDDGDSYGTASTIVDFEASVYDSHSAVTIGAAWKFTAPITGIYLVSAYVEFQSAAYTASDSVSLTLFKNGAAYARLAFVEAGSTTTFNLSAGGSALVSLAATDYIDVRVTNGSGSTALTTTITSNRIEIIKLSQ